ncbi:Lrp/AsnC family transcriptional regulator [Bacillus solimangrovi]|uniref:AsnC family transcriptional regulator n=1 Tax=Bacillus solimangrovi TaxID=1305675 RepID=A0A1E5LJ20_9BACI|nr:Lrp/AsnC family transcriptional regulator [Bacillus solimangrovi]OEH94028.1 AsnC family transcriptional regulator [Bacillus solimangrovi]
MGEKELELLEILEKNGRLPLTDLAKMLDSTEEDVNQMIKHLEDEQIILKYATIVNWNKVDKQQGVTAMIDVKVTPKREVGFDAIAERIYRFSEVKSVYLMSGAYDLSVIIEGETLHQVSRFVSEKLSTLDSVLSTTTHFIMKKYKHDGTIFEEKDKDHRIVVSP